ncbi:MAG TPA: beta-L-arabinofuranosidase domain-containing protein, partial [Capsulimonadaceae bacterium]|nr:beta-L-arabinofuranosidase domain-containing protein [Capsulimonadaceae bacterium]
MSRRQFIQAAGAVSATLALGVRDSKADAPTQSAQGPVTYAARPLPLTAVQLTGGPLKHAQDLDAEYLLKLDTDRMLYYFQQRAGMTPTASEAYGGWEGGGRNLNGAYAGHYLSALSLMYAARGDAQFKDRADDLVQKFAVIQNKHGNGYLGAQENGEQSFDELAKGNIRSGGFDLNGLWSPWYVEHKIFAGLRDAYRYTGNKQAMDVQLKFAGWVASIVDPLSDDQDQKMLRTEFGGMNEVLADLYHDTGDKQWLTLSDKFEHHAVIDPLTKHVDDLGGLHGNTQIPKLIGSQARYEYTGNPADGSAASYFWDAVVYHHSFATGGHGKDEYFGPPDKLADRVDGRTDESCNVYNMVKLTRRLFAVQPDIKYAEYQERALFNHVMGSIDPQDGRTCYMVPVGRSVQHEYQEMFESFTCCMGTGMENHALHAEGLYYESGDKLWVNQYAPSNASWESAGVQFSMDTDFPEGEKATLTVNPSAPKAFTIAMRRPLWAGDGFSVKVNGKDVSHLSKPGSYIDIKRTWKSGDTVAVTLPKVLHMEPLPDNKRRVALMWGPLVLSGDLGPEREGYGGGGQPATPVFVAADRPMSDWVLPVGDHFRTSGVGRAPTGDPTQAHDVDLVPFYRLHRRTYAAYWDLYTPDEWTQKAAEIAAEQEKQKKMEAATVAFAQPGEMQPERDYNQQGEDSMPDRVLGRPGRRGSNWFSFDLPVDPTHKMALVVTYSTQEFRKRTFDILVDGQKVGSQTIE